MKSTCLFNSKGESQGHEIENKFSKVFTVCTKVRTRGCGLSACSLLYYNSVAPQTPKPVALERKEAETGSQLLKS